MSLETEEKLKLIAKEIFSDMLQIEKYAGTAYCTEDESEARFWKGQYTALKRTRQNIERHLYILQIEREKRE